MKTQSDIHNSVRDILGDDYMQLQVTRYSLTEDLATGRAAIATQLLRVGQGPLRSIEGEGVGLVDALFKGIQAALVEEFPSLAHIHFSAFAVSADFRNARAGSRSDAPGTVRATVENASGRRFEFEHTSPSVSASSVAVVLQAVEHFVNAERAVLRVYAWIEDARRRNRADLAERYVSRLAELVQNASYSDTIERERKRLGG
jgi:hypothetical protein